MESTSLKNSAERVDSGAYKCLKKVFHFYDKTLDKRLYYRRSFLEPDLFVVETAEKNGMRCLNFPLDDVAFLKKVICPFILKANDYFVVIISLNKKRVCISDPRKGELDISYDQFDKEVKGHSDVKVFTFQATPTFYKKKSKKEASLTHYLEYLRPYKKYYIQILFGLLLGTFLQILPPFLTQTLVDKGINFRDISLVNLILVGLVVIQIGKTFSQVIREWINFYIGVRIDIAIVSDFIHRILNLPVQFLDNMSVGDILQRIGDHKKVENFLTRSVIDMVFGFFNIIIFWGILFYYSKKIFLIFSISSVLLFSWAFFFLSIRKKLDLNMFRINGKIQSYLIQIFQGAQEIKLEGSSNERRWQWEKNKIDLYHSRTKMMRLDHIQTFGTTLINEMKNILVLYTSANLVIEGEITIGMMLAIQYIMGQANQPVYQTVQFIREAQMSTISLRRLAEISELENEFEKEDYKIDQLPLERDIVFNRVHFRYFRSKNSSDPKPVLKDLKLKIPGGKVTCILGASGCGKSSLLKLLLKFYQPLKGEIKVGDINLFNYNTKWWRRQCGAILHESILFNDTVINNIVEPGQPVNMNKVVMAVKLASIKDDIEQLPLQYETMLGSEGFKVSQGQKQRILLARLIYKNPEYIFLDEATNALDPKTEELVLGNLVEYFKGKTVIFVSHKLHTVKYADNLVVIEKGEIVEFGEPHKLLERKGQYFEMINSIKGA